MFPVMLDLARMPVLLIGSGDAALRRLRQLDELGAGKLVVFAESPSPELAAVAGRRLRPRLPAAADFSGIRVVFLAGVDAAQVEILAEAARAAGTLVNVEDDVPHCDFHVPAMVRRGDLLLTVSTGGRSPALASRLRRALEGLFGMDWAGRLDRLAAARQRWRAAGNDPAMVARRSDAMIDALGWLDGLPSGTAPALAGDGSAPLRTTGLERR